MAHELFTEEWAKALCEQLNGSAGYKQAAASWEGAIIYRMPADASIGVTEDRAIFLDLHHGECRGAKAATSADDANAAYILSASCAVWRELFERKTSATSAIMFGKLKLAKGNLTALAAYTTAANEMIEAACRVETNFPG